MSAAEPAAEQVEQVEDRFSLVGSVLEGKYSIEKVIAEGGFGLVYKGLQSNLGRAVAIKVLKTPPELNAQAAAEFQRKFKEEATVIARHGHPNIVQVIDFGVSPMPSREVAPWMALEWLPGKTLEQIIVERRTPFTPHEALKLMRPVFEALAFVHEAGIAHRDLKPANIMVVESGRVKLPKLMDFGIAKLMDPNESAGSGATRTRSSQNAFSPQYASPEQLSGTRTGPWTDVHALGLILTEMLTGQPAIQGDDMTQLFVQILAERRPTPARFNVDAGPWEQVIQRSLAMKPDDRYKNAMDMLAALDESVPAAIAGSVPEMTGQRPAVTASPTTMRQSAVEIPMHTQPIQPAAKKGWVPIAAVVGLLALVGGGVAFAKLSGSRSADPSTAPHNGAQTLEPARGNGESAQQQQAQQPQQPQQPAGGTQPANPSAVTGTGGTTPTQSNTANTANTAGRPAATRTTTTTGATRVTTPVAQVAVQPEDPAMTRGQRRQQRVDARQQRRTGRTRPTEVPVE